MAQPWIDTLSSASDKTGWFEIHQSKTPVCIDVVVTGTGTYILELSQDLESAADLKTAWTEDTFTMSTGFQIEPQRARLARIRNTSYSSGSAVVQVGKGTNYEDATVDIVAQGTTGSPSGAYA